jgi:hypothetical protein
MTLLESVVASLLFASVATASLGIWSLGLTAEASRSAQERSLDRLDAELNAVDLHLRTTGTAAPAGGHCPTALLTMVAAVASVPTGEGVVRQVAADDAGEGVWVTVAAEGRPADRRRWFSPAALGFCDGGADGST